MNRLLPPLLLAGCFDSSVPLDRPAEELVRGDPPSVDFLPTAVEVGDDGCWQVETLAMDAKDPSIVIESTGAIHVLYALDVLEAGSWIPGPLMHAASGAGGWSIEQVDAQQASRPHAAVDRDGVLHVAYDTPLGLRHAARRDGAWSVEPVAPQAVHGGDYPLALDGAGVPHVAYFGGEQVGPTLFVATSEGGAWQARAVAEDAHDFRSALGFAPDGSAHLTFTRGVDGGGLTHVSDETGPWVSEQVTRLGGNFSALVFDAEGGLHVAQDTDDGGLVVETRAGLRWTAEVLREASADAPSLALREGLEQVGYVWRSGASDPGPGWGTVRLIRRTADRWVDELVDDDVQSATTIGVAAAPDESAVHVVYATGFVPEVADGGHVLHLHRSELRHALRTCAAP